MQKLPALSTIFILLFLLFAAAAHAHWSEPMRISEPGGCSNPQILATGDTLQVVYDNGRGGDKISYVRSTDAGVSWSQYQVISDTSGNIQSSLPRILKYHGRLMVLCYSGGLYGVYDNNIAYIFSNDGGISWEAPEYVLDHNWERPLPIVAANSGPVVNIVAGYFIPDSAALYIIRSTNFGQSWSAPRFIFSTAGVGPFDIAESDSLVQLVWSGIFNQNQRIEIYHIRSTDFGIDWTSSVPISDTDQFHSQLPAIAVNQLGNPVSTWMDYKYAPPGFTGDIFARRSSDSGATWNPIYELVYNHKAVQSDVAIEGDSFYVAWEDESAGMFHASIQFIRSTNNGFSWSEPFRLDQTSDDSRYPALALSNGRVYSVWSDTRYSPDTSGLFFTRWQADPDEVHHDDGRNLPEKISISAYPNPFNATVIINYSSMEGGDIRIVNSLGQLLRDFKVDASGQGRLVWDGKDLAGEPVVSGVYFVSLKSGGQTRAFKLICVK